MRLPVLLFALLLAAACTGPTPGGKMAESACRQQGFDGSRFTVCDPREGQLRLFAAGPGEQPVRSFAALQQIVGPSAVAFAFNAGMFDEDGRPIGMATADGKPKHAINVRDGPGNFHLKPNGVFMVQRGGRAAIYESSSIPSFRCAPQLATQSGPMLVLAGKLHPKLEADGNSRYIRNGVGVTAGGEPLFVISQDPVSLGKFARFFRDELKTPDALYFDGSVSSLWDPANGRMDSHSELGPLIVAFKAEESVPDREARATP